MTSPTLTHDVIEREIFICAGIDHVWSLVAKTGFWVGDDLQFGVDAREGELVTIDAGRHGRFPVRVDRLTPPHYAAYRWASGFPGATPDAANSTLVEFHLAERDGGVLVRVTESGFAALAGPPTLRAAEREGNAAGWTTQLGLLRTAAEAGARP